MTRVWWFLSSNIFCVCWTSLEKAPPSLALLSRVQWVRAPFPLLGEVARCRFPATEVLVEELKPWNDCTMNSDIRMMLPAPLWNWICLLFVPYVLPNIWSPTRLYCDYPVMSSCTAVTPANLGRWMKSVASTRWTRCWAVSFAASCQVESFRRIPITLLTCLDEGTLNNSDVLLVDPNISKLASQQLPNWCVSSGSYASSQAPAQLPQSSGW